MNEKPSLSKSSQIVLSIVEGLRDSFSASCYPNGWIESGALFGPDHLQRVMNGSKEPNVQA
jgi:hypothetical protein